jgi:hypothetical protein
VKQQFSHCIFFAGAISQGDLANALGADTLDELSRQTGMDRGATTCRASSPATFFLACLAALELDGVVLEEI